MMFEKIWYYFFVILPKYPIGILEFLSGFIPIIAFIFLKRKKKESIEKSILFYIICIALLELMAAFCTIFIGNNHKVYLLFYLIESILLIYYFRKFYTEKLPKIGSFILLSFILIFLFDNLIFEKDMNNVSSSIQALVFVVITIYNFYLLLFYKWNKNIFSLEIFWINTGCFIYFSGKIFVSLYLKQLFLISPIELRNYWFIISFLLVIQRIFLAIGIGKDKLQKSI